MTYTTIVAKASDITFNQVHHFCWGFFEQDCAKSDTATPF